MSFETLFELFDEGLNYGDNVELRQEFKQNVKAIVEGTCICENKQSFENQLITMLNEEYDIIINHDQIITFICHSIEEAGLIRWIV